ncbi:MAG TPA: alkaline phosphatase family protein [Candidatus Limnocylindria bacterium]|nr:alkaline phosphatase family protein [Candidatus Limnocylindria bacterium]
MRFLNRARPSASGRRVLVVALDGVPFSFVQRLFRAGEMPNLRAMTDRGPLAQMDTTVPNVSSVAWASFMTGANPGKHNIYGFLDRHSRSRRTYIPTRRDLRAPTLLEILSAAGKRVFSMNVPVTYPPPAVNGTVVGCFLSPNLEKAAPNPEVFRTLQSLNYQVDADPWRARKDKAEFLPHLVDVFNARMAATRHFWRQERWDFFMTHIMETDRLHHFFWEEMEADDPRFAPSFLEFYRRVDDALGEIASWVDDDTTLIVLSDHGFCTIKQEVHVNTWLERNGYLTYATDEPKGLADIDASSVAFSLDPGRIYLNVRGREADGHIDPGETYQRIRSELASALTHMTDPETGAQMVRRVIEREELYSGPAFDAAPDLVLEMQDGYDAKGPFGKPDICFKGNALVGMHTTPDALISISDVSLDGRRPNIVDVAPTILDRLDVRVPDAMDGRSLVGPEAARA